MKEIKNYIYWNGKDFIYKNEYLKLELFYLKGKITRLKEYSLETGNLEFDGEIINGVLKKGKEYKYNELIFEGEYNSEQKLENREQFFYDNIKKKDGMGKEKNMTLMIY